MEYWSVAAAAGKDGGEATEFFLLQMRVVLHSEKPSLYSQKTFP
jgi:hypothetical protein